MALASTNTPFASTGFSANGITTAIFGTDGILNTPAPGGTFAGTGYYIVDSIEPTVKAEQVYVENGAGVEAGRFNIVHGVRWNMVVQDDTVQGAIAVNGTCVIVDSGLQVPGNTQLSGRSNAYNATVIAVSERFQRKQVAMRTIELERLTLIEGGSTPP